MGRWIAAATTLLYAMAAMVLFVIVLFSLPFLGEDGLAWMAIISLPHWLGTAVAWTFRNRPVGGAVYLLAAVGLIALTALVLASVFGEENFEYAVVGPLAASLMAFAAAWAASAVADQSPSLPSAAPAGS